MKMEFKDIKTGQVFTFDNQINAENFMEKYERPDRLIHIQSVYVDGSGWNQKESAIAFGYKDNITICKTDEKLTNNEAEYKATILGIILGGLNGHVFSDSQVVVNQIDGTYACNHPHLRSLRDEARKLKEKYKTTIEWIQRKSNLAGIELEKWKRKQKS